MTDYLELGGKQRPVRFGYAALFQYEKQTGRKAFSDFASMGSVDGVSVVNLVNLVYAGLIAGHRAESVNVDFEIDDVAAWVDNDTITAVMNMFQASFPSAEGNAVPGRTKKAVPAQ